MIHDICMFHATCKGDCFMFHVPRDDRRGREERERGVNIQYSVFSGSGSEV